MSGSNRPWDDFHHRSYFFPELDRIEQDDFRSSLRKIVGYTVVPFDTHGIYIEGNMASISHTIMIDISYIPGKVENLYTGEDCSPKQIMIYNELFKELCDVFTWSYEEIPRIEPRIFEHEIKTYSDVKIVRE
jgi:hypothetical protein